jgi:photosystem II stability/assembly factor-like uncharacterized protein
MFDASSGWGIEATGRVLHTTDGGSSWRDVTPPNGEYYQGGFFARDADNAWAMSKTGWVTNGQLPAPVWHTSDGGKSWQQLGASSPNNVMASYAPRRIVFLDSQTGWVLWDTSQDQMHSIFVYLEKTTDGGKSWEETEISTVSDLYTGLIFLNKELGYAGSRLGLDLSYFFTPTTRDYVEGKSVPEFWKTVDGGKTWTTLQLPRLDPIPAELQEEASQNDQMDCGVTGLTLISPTVILAEVECKFFQPDTLDRGTIRFGYLSADKGQTWRSWLAQSQQFIDAAVGWRLYIPGKDQPGQLQQTTDGSLTWTTLKNVAWQSAEFDFVRASVGWALVSDNNGNTAFLHTGDGGKTWQELKPLITP